MKECILPALLNIKGACTQHGKSRWMVVAVAKMANTSLLLRDMTNAY